MSGRQTGVGFCIRAKKLRASPAGFNRLDARLPALGAAPDHGNLRTCVGQSLGQCAAEYARAANHDCHLATEIEKFHSLLR